MKNIVFVFCFLLLYACQAPEKKDDFGSSIVADSENEQALDATLEEAKKEEEGIKRKEEEIKKKKE
jgi:hypothetical protein